MPRPPSTEKRVRLNLELPVRVRDQLERLRKMSEADSLTEVIRRAVRIFELLLEMRAAKATIIVRAKDGSEKEIIIIS